MRLIAIALLVASVLGFAQQPLAVLERLEISLWPEYDDPRLLVIYRGELAEDLHDPMVFVIPATAQVHVAAYVDPEGDLVTDDWQVLPAGGEQRVIFWPDSRQFQFEYYDDVIGTSPERSFIFRFQSYFYEVKELTIKVQQPLGARGLQGIPELTAVGGDSQGFSYFLRKAGPVPVGTVVEQRISYIRTERAPSLRASWGLYAVWLIIGGITVGVAIALWWWGRRQRSGREPAAQFCTHCRRQFRSDEQFCPQCGRRRTP